MENNKVDLLNRWSYKLNNHSPKDVSYASNTYGYFNCSKDEKHAPRKVKLNNVTCNSNKVVCKSCNSFGSYLSEKYGYELANYIWSNKNSKSMFDVSRSCKTIVYLNCPNCGNEIVGVPNNLCNKLVCRNCGDGISYPNKFVASMLLQCGIKFKTEMIFDWDKSKRYDFYIPSKNCIVEIHGGQHFSKGFETLSGKTLQDTIENDTYKKEIAINNGITHYYSINASESTKDFISNSILKSGLLIMLGVDFKCIDFERCDMCASKTIVKEICDEWNKGNKDTMKISVMYNIHRSTVIRYLNKGSELGLCDYDGTYENTKRILKIGKDNGKMVVVIDGDDFNVYNSIVELVNAYDKNGISLNKNNVSQVCRGEKKTHKGMKFMYYDDLEEDKLKLYK